jgi:hypothetical protein
MMKMDKAIYVRLPIKTLPGRLKRPEILQSWHVMRNQSKLLSLYSLMMISWEWRGDMNYC